MADSCTVQNSSGVAHASELFRNYGDFIRAVIDNTVRDRALADDIFQDLFVFFTIKRPPENVQNMKGYIYKVAMSKIYDAARRNQERDCRAVRYANLKRPTDPPAGPLASLITAEQMDSVIAVMLEYLRKSERQAITMRYIEQRDDREIAGLFGVNVKTIHRYIATGLRKIRNHQKTNKDN